MTLLRILRRTVLFFFITSGLSQKAPYYGLRLGTLETFSNKVGGEVFAVDDTTLFLKGFYYDGQSEDAVFWAGSTDLPDSSGFIIPTDISSFKPIPEYNNEDILLRIQEGKNVKNIRWLSVWNRNASTSLGTLVFPNPIHPPHPMTIGPLVNTKKGVSTGDILILDTQTFLVPDFNYDGSGKETYWWLSNGTKPNEFGIRLQENGRDGSIQENKNSTIILTLPNGNFVMDYDTLSIWNAEHGEDYGFVDVPKNLNVPPSPRILGKQELKMEEFNCEMLNDNLGLEVRWLIKGDDIIFHLIGNIGPLEYMTLGLSKDDTETRFDSSDAVVAGIGSDGRGYAIDYFFESNEKCENGRGMCPDSVHGSVDNLNLLHAERGENSTTIIFKRRLRADDKVYDQNIYTDGPQAILWAVGPLHSDGFADTPTLQSRGNLLLDFGREPNWNCPPPKEVKTPTSVLSEKKHHIHCPGDQSFRAQIGSSSPGSNEQKVWYINGLPTPDLTVQRGSTYIFIIEGGLSASIHHPFYITSSKEGGLLKNILEASEAPEYTFAGIEEDPVTGTIFPTAEGRLCDWTFSEASVDYSIVTVNKDIKPALNLKCEPGQPGKLLWTPSAGTPDVVYYQSFSERNLGGKIKVVDFCEETNPHRYLEVTVKGGKPRPPQNDRIDLERENEDNGFTHYSNIKTEEKLSAGESREQVNQKKDHFQESIPAEFIYDTPPRTDKYTVTNNVLNSVRRSSDEDGNNNYEDAGSYMPEHDNVTSSEFLQVPKREMNDPPFPHDESERSDVYLPHQTELQKIISRNKATFDSHRFSDDKLSKHPAGHSSEISSIPALSQPRDFKPHFESGFVPLVVNPMKEQEFSLPKQFIYPPQPRNRPYRPFLYNESVPFHGTFKPGVPDFSGFNISHYSQEDASIIIAPSQDNLSLLPVSKSYPVHKRVHPIGSVPLHLLQRHNGPPQRPFQRPQDFGLRYRQQNPSFNDPRKNLFPHLSLNNKPSLPISNIKDDDLAEVSSQRVYVSLQASGDKTPAFNMPNRQLQPPYNPLHQNQQQGKIIYPPPIQRRPDFYEEREAGFNRKNPPQRKFVPQGMTSNLNKRNNHQKANLPALQSGGLFGQLNMRQKMPGSNIPPKNNLPLKTEQTMIPPGQLRHPYPLQVPLRERIPQRLGIPIRPIPPTDQNLKLNLPHNGERMILPFPASNINGKLVEKPQEIMEFQESQESDSSSSEEQRALPLLVNAELVEVPNKSMAQKDNPIRNSGLVMPNIHLGGSTNLFTDRPNIRNTFIAPNLNQPLSNQKILPLGKVYDFSLSPEDIKILENISGKDKMSNIPVEINSTQTDGLDVNTQNTQSNRNNMKKHEEISENINDSEKLNIHRAKYGHHELVETAHEVTAQEIYVPSQHIKVEEVSDFTDYEQNLKDSQNKDSVLTLLDHAVDNAPFGARLKFPQNGTNIPLRILKEIHKSPIGVPRNPNLQTNTRNRFSVSSTKSAESSNTEKPIIIKESVSSSISINKEENVSDEGETVKHLYYSPPFSSLIPEFSNESSNQHFFQSDDVKHIPIIADSLEGYIETRYLRKNILPNNSNSSFPLHMMPPRPSENINLPQISESPPTHDNGTDYSILNHIMALIGGPQESEISEDPS